MKNHIFGFTVFCLIVGSAIFVQNLFSYPEVNVPAVSDNDGYKNSCWRMKRRAVTESVTVRTEAVAPITYELKNINFDTKTSVLTGKITLFWSGTGRQPDSVATDLNLFTVDQPNQEISFASQLIPNPFADSNLVERNFAVKIKDTNSIKSKANYYAFANLWILQKGNKDTGDQTNETMTKVILNPDQKLAESVPVLMIGEK